MLRAAVLLLFCGFLRSALSQYFSWNHTLAKDVDPCHDFYEFVCNPSANREQTVADQQKNRFRQMLVDALVGYHDPIFDFMRKIYYKKGEFQGEQGVELGSMVAEGYKGVKVTKKVGKKFLAFEELGKGPFTHSKCVYEKCPSFVKGFITTSHNLSSYSETLKVFKGWKIRAIYKIDEELLEKTIVEKIIGSNDDHLSPYFNLVIAKASTEKNLWVSEEIDENIRKIGDSVTKKAIEQIEETWMSESKKRKIADSVKVMERILGIPSSARDVVNLQKAIAFFGNSFKINESFFALLHSCDFTCQVEQLKNILKMAKSDYLSRSEVREDGIARLLMIQQSLATYNAYNAYEMMTVLPALYHYTKDDLSVGLRYGHVAFVIAHEIFHSLDYNFMNKRAVNSLNGTPEYDQGYKCYKNYYQSFNSTNPEGFPVVPNGALKVNEGFCDVEGSRVAVKALEEVIFDRRYFKKSYSYSAFHDMEWAFIGGMVNQCNNDPDYWQYNQAQFHVHPRSRIRFTAQIRQLEEFSDIFRCKKEDPMYVVEKQCRVFT
ncbi:hypothetical protein L596_029036 [Steinernema carpocapsae]|uniref:Peptidase M13 C-terminal domain-containing protein n=1 Tax=Steinernema carpocapsae TaxID=34508 RepID=A0A4U5LTF4_STECR|nr:hypothetical protein L596_029036 [Steinernema carpocapsae]